METTQAPQLGISSKIFIFILTISVIFTPIVFVHIFKNDIQRIFVKVKETIEVAVPPSPQTYTASDFKAFGKATNNNGWIGNIDTNSGFRFSANSENNTTAKLSIKYKSDNRSGILKVNDEIQNLYFPSTNWNVGTKEVIAQMKQGQNSIEFCGGWLTDNAPDIAEITVKPDNNIRKDDISGVWKGTYTENNTNGIGNLTLTINDDMSGTIEFVIKRKTERLNGSYSVSVNNYNGTYNVVGREFINKPNTNNYGFDNFSGTVSNGVFSGMNFKFEKVNPLPRPTVKTEPIRNENNAEKVTQENINVNNDIVGVWSGWQETNGEKMKLTLTINKDMSGIEKFYNSNGTVHGSCTFSVDYSNDRYLVTEKKWIIQPLGWWLGNFQGTINNGQFSGKTNDGNPFQLDKVNTAKNKVDTTPNSIGTEHTQNSENDYDTKIEDEVNKTVKEAENAFGNGKYDDAFRLYLEAANKSVNGMTIKKDAAKKYFERAKELINTLGECDANAKNLLLDAKQLYPSNEINTLLNLCN